MKVERKLTIGLLVKAMLLALVLALSLTACAPVEDEVDAIKLNDGQWVDGEITSGQTVLYKISVNKGTRYYVWWNNAGTNNGDGTKTASIKVSNAYAYSGKDFVFSPAAATTYGWTTAWGLSADITGTIVLKVEGTAAGTYAIVYSTSNAKPDTPAGPPPDDITYNQLTVNVWTDGELEDEEQEDGYKFEVTSGTQYKVWWNESETDPTAIIPRGDGTKTARIQVSATYDSGAAVSTTPVFSDTSGGWSNGRYFTANRTGTVYLKVKVSGGTTNLGTYGIAYSTGTSGGTRPIVMPTTAVQLTANEWHDGNRATTTQVDWYSFDVTDGQTYYVWWNELPGTSSSFPNGDGTKTADIEVSAVYEARTTVADFTAVNSAWNTSKSFTATASGGKVYLKVAKANYATSSTNTGTYAIVYSTTNTRPSDLPAPGTAIPLTINEWKTDGELTAQKSVVWYSTDNNVQGNWEYHVWWNEAAPNGDGTKTADIVVTAYDGAGTKLSGFIDADEAWNTSKPFTKGGAVGTVYFKVEAKSDSTLGTFGIVYSNLDTKPTY